MQSLPRWVVVGFIGLAGLATQNGWYGAAVVAGLMAICMAIDFSALNRNK